MTATKFECVKQLVKDFNIAPIPLLYSLEAYFGAAEMREALEYISRVEDWHIRVDNGIIVDARDDEE